MDLRTRTATLIGLALCTAACASPGFGKRAKVSLRASATELAAEERLLTQPFALAVPEDAIVRIVGPVMTCTGTVIQDDLILTAHHCLVERGPKGEFSKTLVAPRSSSSSCSSGSRTRMRIRKLRLSLIRTPRARSASPSARTLSSDRPFVYVSRAGRGGPRPRGPV